MYVLKIDNKYVKDVINIISFTRELEEARMFSAYAVSRVESKYPNYKFEKLEVV